MQLPKGYVIIREEELLQLQQHIISLVERIKELEQRLNKDSSNSHKPPSSDSFRKPIQNNREKSNKNQGAQPGHKGTTLTMAEHPDKIIFHPVGGKCDCGRELKMQPTINVQRSQVIDIPEKLKEITEHQIEVKQCKCGQIYYGETLSMAPVQYGSRIKAMSVYMNNYGLLTKDHKPVVIPKDKVSEMLPWVHLAISNAKRLLLDVHHDVKPQYLQGYLNEFCYKYNRRYFGEKLFDRLLIACVSYKNEF